MRSLSLTRRRALRLGAAGLAGLALARPAMAAPGLAWPARLAYVRAGPRGFVYIRSDEQLAWSRLQTRLGELIAELEPMQPETMLGRKAPIMEAGPSCAMLARKMAVDAGFGHVIVYATHDGQRTGAPDGDWFGELFAQLRAGLKGDGRASGEAYLLDAAGGAPLLSVSADVPPRDPLNLFDNARRPEREVLMRLTDGVGERLAQLARPAFVNARSIAD